MKKVSLNVKCPHCYKSFMDHTTLLSDYPSIKLNIEASKERGTIRLCSVYGCHEHLCDIKLAPGEIVNFFCPHCNKELKSDDTCSSKNCNAPMIPLILQLGGKVFICARKDCTNHFVAFEDLAGEVRKFYHEYGF